MPSGLIDFRAYEANPAAFHRVEWLPPKPVWVDPKKDAEAEILMVNAGFKSRTQVVTGLGYDPEQVDAEIAADVALAKRLGLTFSPAPPSTTTETADPAEIAANG